MEPTSDVKAFFIELFNRAITKSPVFFKLINYGTYLAFVLCGVPYIVSHLNNGYGLHIVLPLWYSGLQNDAVMYLAFGMRITSQFTTQRAATSTAKGLLSNGKDTVKLPFTNKKEN